MQNTEYLELQNNYQKLLGEFNVIRQANLREQQEIIEEANNKLIGDLVTFLDGFDAFLKTSNEFSIEEYVIGVSNIRDEFLDLLIKYGLEIMDPVGQPFDPNLHEALMMQASSEVPSDHIVNVYQKGYLVNGKVIRHAQVIVSE